VRKRSHGAERYSSVQGGPQARDMMA